VTARVVDGSVVAKVFFEEDHSDASRRLLAGGTRLLAPDLLRPEFANVVWKRFTRGDVTADDASGCIRDFLALPVEVYSSAGLIADALEIAIATGRAVYDCVYLALAVRQDIMLVTADRRFFNALLGAPFAARVEWIGDAE
jgi:predicted nucleic acid-binding protein